MGVSKGVRVTARPRQAVLLRMTPAVLRLDGRPLPNVTLEIEGHEAETGHTFRRHSSTGARPGIADIESDRLRRHRTRGRAAAGERVVALCGAASAQQSCGCVGVESIRSRSVARCLLCHGEAVSGRAVPLAAVVAGVGRRAGGRAPRAAGTRTGTLQRTARRLDRVAARGRGRARHGARWSPRHRSTR